MKAKIGFIGLGLMGNPMSQNLLKKGFSVGVYNRTKSKTKLLQRLGATVYDSPANLAKNSDIVISMVTAPKDVKEVHMGKNGVIRGAHKDAIVIDMSTIGPTAAIEIAKALKKKNIQFIDAPVTGSVNRAQTGELTIFAAGNEEAFKKAKPILQALGNDIHYMGVSGNGQIIKLINNLIIAETLTALAEGFLLGDALGLPRQQIADALQNVFGISPGMRLKLPHMVSGTHPVAFSMNNMNKDLSLARKELQKRKNLPLLEKTARLYKKGVKNKLGNQDVSAVLEVLVKEL